MTATDSRTVTVNGQQLMVDVRPGNGTGTPLLLCSGIGLSYQIFDRLIAALDPSIEIIRVDVPGVGGSPVRAWPYGFPELAHLLARLLGRLSYQKVDVVGFSWGGSLAQQFAVQYPTRCRRLVLISSSPGVLAVPGQPAAVAEMLRPNRFRGGSRATGLLYRGDNADRGAGVRRLFKTSQAGGSSLGYFYHLVAAASWSSLPFLAYIKQPALIMGDDADTLVPAANSRLLAQLIPNATPHLYAGGHVEPLVAATDFGRVITGFLSSELV